MSKNMFLSLYLFYLFLIAELDGTLILFYKNKNYSGLLFQSTSNSRCINVSDGQQFVGSIKTDTCVIVYKDANCKSEWSWKKKPDDGMIWPSFIGSFHICNEDEGGSKLNVDITTYTQNILVERPTVLQSFANLCTCHNLPNSVQEQEKWSIDNHGNDLLVFYEPNCSERKWKAEKVRAGFSTMSRNMHSLLKMDTGTNMKYKIKSISPVRNFTAKCGIMEIELMELFNNTRQQNSELLENTQFKKLHRPRIQFFEQPDFEEYLFDRHSTAKCTNLPRPNDDDFVTDEILSIKTNTCIMLHSNYNCKGRSIKLEAGERRNLTFEWESTVTGPNTLASLYQMNPNWKWYTKSFSFCNADSSRLNVNITEYQDEKKETTAVKVLKEYKDICTCQNIPKFIRNKDKWSINNLGNSLVAYFEHDCMSDESMPLWIPAGRSSFTIGFGSFKQINESTGVLRKIRAFGPDYNSAYFKNNCVKMFSTIKKFEIDELADTNYEERNITMTASKTTFRNDGPSQLTQTYTASKSVRELVQIEIGKTFSKMNSVHVDKSVDIETRKHKGNSESSSTGSSSGLTKSNSNSASLNFISENRKSTSEIVHESVDGRHTTNVGLSVQVGASVDGSASFLGTGVRKSASVNVGVNTGYEYSSHNTQGSNRGSVKSESNSRGQTVGQEESSGWSRATNVGHEKSANFFQEDGFRQGLRKAYDKSGTTSSSKRNSSSLEHTKSFEVSQTISVPPCTEQVVHASVKVVINKRVEYRAITEITGLLGDRQMTANEVYQFMDKGFEYIDTVDEHTILAFSTGHFTAEYGVSSVINAKGSVIETCQEKLSGCPVCQICVEEPINVTTIEPDFNEIVSWTTSEPDYLDATVVY